MADGVKFNGDKLQILKDSDNHKVWQDATFDDINKLIPIVRNLTELKEKMSTHKDTNKAIKKNVVFDEFEMINNLDVKLMKVDDVTFDAINESPFYIPAEKEDDLTEFVCNKNIIVADVFSKKKTKSRRNIKMAESNKIIMNYKKNVNKNKDYKYSDAYLKRIDSYSYDDMRELVEEFYSFKGLNKKRGSGSMFDIFCKKTIKPLNIKELLEVRIEIESVLKENLLQQIENLSHTENKAKNKQSNDIDEIKLIKLKNNVKAILPDWMHDDELSD